jgi:GT2 family glycosyltransferase
VRIVVGIATAGRPQILRATLAQIARQSRQPDAIIICPASVGDVDRDGIAPQTEIVFGAPGLTRQRNRIIEQAQDAGMLVFFDDDFFPEMNFLAHAETLFANNPDIVMATGLVLADGINGAGLDQATAGNILESATAPTESAPAPVHNAYGCNMVIRMAPVVANDLRFDPALPLYGWLEDVDFSRRLAKFGRIVKSSALQGVHLGVKGGRNSGLRFGYSQIANPLYLATKGTLAWHRALAQIARNMAKNAVKMRSPEPWIDRRGRSRGNFLALADLLRGKLSPSRILDLD